MEWHKRGISVNVLRGERETSEEVQRRKGNHHWVVTPVLTDHKTNTLDDNLSLKLKVDVTVTCQMQLCNSSDALMKSKET